MEQKTVGAQTRRLRTCPSVLSFAAVGGRFEGEGPLREYFDELSEDHFFGEKTWEKGESTMQRHALSRALEKVGLKVSDLDLIFAGDLLNQCVGSAYGLLDFDVPYFGLYGACSTAAEGLALAAMAVSGGMLGRAAAVTSSHNAAAERQYRSPLEYGGQRPPTAQWTVTGAGAFIVGGVSGKAAALIADVMPGVVVEKGATVEAAVVMGGTVIKAGAKVEHCIVAENVTIEEGATVGKMPESGLNITEPGDVATVGSGVKIGKGATVGPKAMISNDVKDGEEQW